MRKVNEGKLDRVEMFIKEYIRENNGDSPKFADIIEHGGLGKSTTLRYIQILADRGKIIYNGKNTLAVPDQNAYKLAFRRVPIMGIIPCGDPDDLCRENILGYLAIPEEWIEGNCYLLRVKGDSMVDIGIEEEDLVIIKVASKACDGQVVAALTEDGPTLKRYIEKEGSRPWLLAENKRYTKSKRYLYPQKIEIQGIALKIIKDIK